MTEANKRIAFSLLLIVLASAILLWSDRHNRHSQNNIKASVTTAIPLAILQHSSNPLMDDVRSGVLDALNARGYKDGQNLAITTYNPEGDLPTANLMAQKIISGDYRLAISISTVMLQALANANRTGRVTHVFGAVTVPVASGVGIKALDSLDKPAHLTGLGTPQPVAEIFRMAKQVNPALKTVGVVWNPAEVNSEFCTKQARAVSAELGLVLLEAPVEQAKDIREAAQSLVARGAEAIWTGGDATVNSAVDSLIEVARTAHIPVFSNISGHVRKGSLFDLGADYHEVGEQVGRLAADILSGANPAVIPVKNYMPKRILLNEKTRKALLTSWIFSKEMYVQAASVIGENGIEVKAIDQAVTNILPSPITIQAGRNYKVGVAYYAPEPGIDSVMAGLREGLNVLGLEEGRNLAFQNIHAQGEIAQIPTIGQVLDSSDVDAILTLTTPVLQGVGMMAKHKPVVFTYVSDPLAAGAGKSFAEHLTNLTGIGSFPPVEDMLAMTRKVLPGIHSLGTLYNPSEVNSVKVVGVLRDLCRKAGLILEEVPINTTADVVQAAQALVARNVNAIVSVGDNTMYQALDAVASIASKAGIPLILDQPEFISHDALMVVGVDYKESGRAAAEPLVQVLTGKNPATIPFRNVSKKSIILNEGSAKRLNIVFSDEVRALATSTSIATYTKQASQPLDHKWKIKRISYVESSPAEDNQQGIDDGFKAAGMQVGRDFELSDVSAQGDMTVLSSLADAVGSDGTELVMTLSTPTLQTIMHKVKKIPVLFSLVSNAVIAGAGTDENNHLPNVTGVSVPAPIEEMVVMIKQYFPEIHRVGSLFTPGEDNSVYNMNLFEKTAIQHGLSVLKLPVNSSSELPNAALAMASQPIDAWVQIVDNQMVSGFVAIAQAATRAKKPLFTFSKSGVEQGAAVAYSTDYYQAGFDAALKAIEVMHGKSPKDIPFSRTSKINLIVSEEHAKNLHMKLPVELIGKADLRLSNHH